MSSATLINRNKPRHNRRLAQWRVMWLIEHSTSHQLLWCIDSLVLRNPPLRQAPKRCASFLRQQLSVKEKLNHDKNGNIYYRYFHLLILHFL